MTVHRWPIQHCFETINSATDVVAACLRDIGERVLHVKSKVMDVLPLIAVYWGADVVRRDLCLVEQMLDNEHHRCNTHIHTQLSC